MSQCIVHMKINHRNVSKYGMFPKYCNLVIKFHVKAQLTGVHDNKNKYILSRFKKVQNVVMLLKHELI